MFAFYFCACVNTRSVFHGFCSLCTVLYSGGFQIGLRLDIRGSLRADAFALQKIGQYQGGKILLWAWISRGLITMEQVASWRFDGDVSAAREAMESTEGELAKLYQADEIPNVDCSKEAREVNDAAIVEMDGEISSAWAISDFDDADTPPSTPPIFLPQWFQLPINKAVLLWRQEKSVWDERFASRLASGFTELPPKMQQAYDAWKEDTTRPLVLSKRTKTQVKKLTGKSISSLKRHCILLVLHMNSDAGNLAIKSGEGKLWRLRLMEGRIPASENVPPQVDHFHEGQTFTVQYSRELVTCFDTVYASMVPMFGVRCQIGYCTVLYSTAGGRFVFWYSNCMTGDLDGALQNAEVDQPLADTLVPEDMEDFPANEDISDLHQEDSHQEYMFVDTDSDSEVEAIPTALSGVKRVRCLASQPEYERLKSLGLATRPEGCTLGCHPSARVYRAWCQGSTHFSRSYGEASGRSPWQALLRVMELMLESFVQSNAQNKLAKKQLNKIKALRADEPAHAD